MFVMKFGKKSVGAVAAGLSLVMALSPVAALADDAPATTTGVKIGKTVTMNAGSTLTAGFKFTFTKTQLFPNTVEATAPVADVPTINDQSIASQDWTSKTGKVELTLTLPEKSAFKHAGVYAWTVTEAENTYTAGDNETLTYNTGDTKSYTLVAVVTNDTTGTDGTVTPGTVTWGFYNGTPVRASDVQGVTKAGEADFTNEYVEETDKTGNSPLVITKHVTGAQGDKTKKFDFTVSFSAPDNVPDNWTVNSITAAANDAASDLHQNDDGSWTFKAADAGAVTFDNVVVGTTYTVTESDYSGAGYTTTYSTVSNNQQASQTHENVLVGENTNSADVTNEKASSVVTGLIVNNAPFIVMIGVAAAGVAAYGTAKRKLEK